jgi:hypothetical protein
LTVQTGALLLLGLAALGVTILRIGQLTWLHMFLGLALIGPVALKIGSTSYRFARYYTRDIAYHEKGPPELALRLLGPLVVLSTIGVFSTGVVLLALGPSSRGTWLLLHKVFFFIWLALMAVHVLGHLPDMGRGLASMRAERGQILRAAGADPGKPAHDRPTMFDGRALAARLAGGPARAAALAAAILAGLVLAGVLIPHFAPWVYYHR